VEAARAAYTPSGPGKSSIAITAAAIGVFAAAASIATSPTAAKNVVGMPKTCARAAPLVADQIKSARLHELSCLNIVFDELDAMPRPREAGLKLRVEQRTGSGAPGARVQSRRSCKGT
jgi:hypothetical protein